ncbi:MAG: NrfD/PsrC family molybdoenzyme membrane anchor subunit [Dehalococcoidia bacterium]|nr:NrfD/PsrC family molybdoenzyme membrane anchor subunit [Dehalococcoidia bacterium]
MRAAAESYTRRLERVSLAPLWNTSTRYRLFVFFLLAIVAWGVYAYVVQLRYGLAMTGMNDQVNWGFYIFNFVFWIGVSHVGALISAILRLTNAGWRTPLTRLGELITISALLIGAAMIIVDMGRPDRLLNLLFYGRFQSPLIWDVIGVATYLTGSLIYLYLPTIPDFAMIRDRLRRTTSTIKLKLYTFLAVGWRGTPEQKARLDKGVKIMSVMIIPIAVSVHTVVAFVFAMTLRPGWDSTVLAPNFVIGALFSGMSALMVVMGAFRKFCHLEEYITPKHFKNISYLAIVLLFAYFYFVFVEYSTVMFKFRLEEKELFTLLLVGQSAPWFWLFFTCAFVLPSVLLLWQREPTIPRLVIAGILVNIGMWVKRFVIVVPSMEVPLMPTDFHFATYMPSWVEISIVAAGLAGFILLLTLSAKIMPVMPFVEMVEEAEEKHAEGKEEKHVQEQHPVRRRQGV